MGWGGEGIEKWVRKRKTKAKQKEGVVWGLEFGWTGEPAFVGCVGRCRVGLSRIEHCLLIEFKVIKSKISAGLQC